jgi:hypothetical protein
MVQFSRSIMTFIVIERNLMVLRNNMGGMGIAISPYWLNMMEYISDMLLNIP